MKRFPKSADGRFGECQAAKCALERSFGVRSSCPWERKGHVPRAEVSVVHGAEGSPNFSGDPGGEPCPVRLGVVAEEPVEVRIEEEELLVERVSEVP